MITNETCLEKNKIVVIGRLPHGNRFHKATVYGMECGQIEYTFNQRNTKEMLMVRYNVHGPAGLTIQG